MAKKSTIVDPADGAIIYPQTLVDCVQDESGTLLENLVLMKDNTTEFTPTADYQPATKGYVDSKVSTEISNQVTPLSTTIDNKQAKITASGLLKGNGNGGISGATAGTDYAPGGFGLGTACINISSTDILSVYHPNGMYMGQKMTNSPDGSTSWFYFLIMNYSNEDYRKIIALRLTGDSNNIYSNTKCAGTWTGWVQIYPAVYSS
nr:MAG TPA: hypothetical protein [Bacteriophage sp.]